MCAGTLIWFPAGEDAAVLECTACGYIVVTGNFHDEAHAHCDLIQES